MTRLTADQLRELVQDIRNLPTVWSTEADPTPLAPGESPSRPFVSLRRLEELLIERLLDKAPEPAPARAADLTSQLLELFMATGKPVLTSEAAKQLGTSTAKVNAVLNENGSVFDLTDVEVPRYERNFNTIVGYRMAPAYVVTRRHLALMVRELRASPAAATPVNEGQNP